jgi:hypothetical protein
MINVGTLSELVSSLLVSSPTTTISLLTLFVMTSTAVPIYKKVLFRSLFLVLMSLNISIVPLIYIDSFTSDAFV